MAGVDNLVVYMQTAVKYNTFYINHPGGVYTNCCILQQFAYKSSTPTISLFFLSPNPVVVYIFGVPIYRAFIYLLLARLLFVQVGLRVTCCATCGLTYNITYHINGRRIEGVWEARWNCSESVWGECLKNEWDVPGKCVRSVRGVWEVCGKRQLNAQEVSEEDVLEVVGFAELSAKAREAPR